MQKNYWIWYPGDYEIYHVLQANLRREERGYGRPAFWKQHSPWINVKFQKTFECDGGYIKAHFSGSGYIALDGVRYKEKETIAVKAGRHTVEALVSNFGGLPALFVESDVCPSDETWLCDPFLGDFIPVGSNGYFDSADKDPEVFPFAYENRQPVSVKKLKEGILYDFGTELFGYLLIAKAEGKTEMGVFYGESEEEALDTAHSYITDSVRGQSSYRLKQRAFRYVYITSAPGDLEVSMDYEYLPLEQKGFFRCDNSLFNDIYSTAVHTFHLNCREGFLDGIKRDRWIWAGDAYQSAKINAYLFFDREIAERTAIGMAGRAPVEQHLNTILDYSLLWIIGLYEHYMTYGNRKFLRSVYPMAENMLAFCETRINQDGFIEGFPNDWTFIDWSDIDKTGAVCAEQMLLIAAYFALEKIAEALRLEEKGFAEKGRSLKERVNEYYWKEDLGAFIDSYASGKNNVTRHANIFAVMYGIADEKQTQSILHRVLKNEQIPQITTPYFKGYELDVLAKLGQFSDIEKVLDSYWGGMLRLGAKTIWEAYDPKQKGIEHYAMYDDKYDRSLCHAWGAGPIYLFGRYYLGVYPTAPGYETFDVAPNPGGLKEICGSVPVNGGTVTVELDSLNLRVTATKPGGTLLWQGRPYSLLSGVTVILPR